MKFKTILVVPVLFVIMAMNVFAQRWEQVGKKGDWANTVEVVGTLFKTNTKTGVEEQVGGKGSMRNVDDMFILDGFLYAIEEGTLYRMKI